MAFPTTDFRVPPAPLPPSGQDSARWDATRLRERMMDGTWASDLATSMESQLGRIRAVATGSTDMSSCLLRTIATQLAVLYDRPPTVTHAEGVEDLIGSDGLITNAGLWTLMGGIQSHTIALGEMLCAVSITPDGMPLYRPVSPGYIVAESSTSEPDEPIAIRELRLRTNPTTRKLEWFWDVWRPRDLHFSIRAIGRDGETDATSMFITDPDGVPVSGPLEGEAYPYQDERGGVLPYGFWHSARTGRLWNVMQNQTVVSGTLTAAVGYNYWWHCLRDASYPQRYAVNVTLPGLGIEDSTGARRAELVTDPSTILMMEQSDLEGGGQPMIGQWKPGADAKNIIETLSLYELRICQAAGINPSDIQRVSGQAQSGYAISIGNAGKRAAQAKYQATQKRGDIRLIETTARMLNATTGSRWPVSGYAMRYAAVPKSATELDGERRHVIELMDAGLIDRADALIMLHGGGMTRDEAIRRLAAIAQMNAAGTETTSDAITAPGLVDMGAEKAQDTALNGAQVLAAQTIVASVSAGQLPRGTGVQMLSSFFNLPTAVSEAIMGTVGRSFTPTSNDA